ncbi:MAG: type II toxin-antitoxin system VapC family toxin [Solirubrobacteraceae bacterium]
MSPRSAPRDAGPPYLLDTHIWFWYLLASDRLPGGLREALEGSSCELWLSPISIWELALLHDHGRIELFGGPRSWVQDALRRVPLRDAPLSREVALRSRELALPHRDPADRFLAATALVHGLTLMTVNDRLREADWLPTRSD